MDICDLLLSEGLLSEQAVHALRRKAQRQRVALVGVVVADTGLPPDQVAALAAAHSGLEHRAGPLAADRQAAALVSWEEAKRWLILPVGFDEGEGRPTLRVALADPLDAGTMDFLGDLEQKTSQVVRAFVADLDHLMDATDRAYSALVTQVVTRPRGPKPRQEWDGSSSDEPTTVPSYAVAADATMAVRIQALVELLEHKGLVTRDEYAEWVRRVMERQGE